MAAAPRLSGPRRLARGTLASGAAVGSAAAAHFAAGHQGPHALVVVLALAVSLPLCTALAGVRLGRARLTVSVLVSQAVLHALFSALPASAAGRLASVSPHSGHGGHGEAAMLPGTPGIAAPGPEQTLLVVSSGGTLDVGMLGAHLGAAALTIALLHRGETLLRAFADLLALGPVRLLMTPREALFGVRRARPIPPRVVRTLEDLWAGRGPRTLRGPPATA